MIHRIIPFRLSVLALSIVSLVFQGCAGEQNLQSAESAPEVKAASLIADSFIAPPAESADFIIKKDALQKEFLLQSVAILQPEVPMGEGLKSRIVVFHKYGKNVYLLEASEGHSITKDLPQELVLAVYPILAETEETLTLDFNTGMSHLFTSGDWNASDMSGRKYNAPFAAVKIQNSRLATVRATKSDTLLIRQIAQVEQAGGFFSGPSLPSIEVRYYLKPYRPSADYKPVISKGFDVVGYFEAAPFLTKDGSTAVFATRFHPKKPIVFAVSANTPAEYKEAVKEGILYWNKSLPEPLIQVVDAPAGLSAPDPDYNIVQWVPWDQAGFAYADAQMDPRTGEILHAQVYLTSAFAVSGKTKARKLLATLKSKNGAAQGRTAITLSGFQTDSQCRYNQNKTLVAGLTTLLAGSAEEEQILKASKDYIRTTTAHEIGHTLGLRHNFAGSSHNENFDGTKREEIFKHYIQGGELSESMLVSSSMMDYPVFEDDVFMGYRIAKGHAALPYDKIAVSSLYSDTEAKREETPAYCADSKVEQYADCLRFDFGSSVVESGTVATESQLKTLPYSLLEEFIEAKAPLPNDFTKPVSEVGFDHEKIADAILMPREQLLHGMSSDTRLLSVVREFPYVSPVNIETVRAREREVITTAMDKIGGMNRVFALIEKDYAETTQKRFEELLASETHTKGIGPGGQAYSFDENEKKAMSKNVADLLGKLPLELAKRDLEILAQLPAEWKVTGTKLGDALTTAMAARVDEYVFTQKKEVITVDIEIPTAASKKDAASRKPEDTLTHNLKAQLPLFYYPIKVRKAAAPILKPGSEPDSIDWAFAERAQYKEDFAKRLSVALGCASDDICKFADLKPEEVKVIPPAELSPEEVRKLKNSVTRWILENKSVLEAF